MTGQDWSLLLVSACAWLATLPVRSARERIGRTSYCICYLLCWPLLLSPRSWPKVSFNWPLLFITPDVFHVAFIRTLTVCSVALALAFGGARWQRLEMTRIAYAALAFMAAKLIFEDLRHGRMEFIAGSFFLFAVTLITVPRLAKRGRKH